MGLAERLDKLEPSAPGLPCGISKILSGLNEKDKTALDVIMSTPSKPSGISNRAIHEILLTEGYDIAFASVRLHRTKQCRCYTGKYSEKRRNLRAVSAESNDTEKVEKIIRNLEKIIRGLKEEVNHTINHV